MKLINQIHYKITLPTFLLLTLLVAVTATSSHYLSRMQESNNDLTERFYEINEVRDMERSAIAIARLFNDPNIKSPRYIANEYYRHEASILNSIIELEREYAVVNEDEREILNFIRDKMVKISNGTTEALNANPFNPKELYSLSARHIEPLISRLGIWHEEELELVIVANKNSNNNLDNYIKIMYYMGSMVFITILFSFFFYYFILTRRIVSISSGTHILGKGDLGHKIVIDGNDELTNMAKDINHLADQMNDYQVQLQKIARTDSLTGLYNRYAMEEILQHEIARSKRAKSNATVVLLDIDHFKKINDSYGHASGDAALQHVSRILKDTSRAGDYIFRIGGEEFLVYLTECKESHIIETAERLRLAIEHSQFMNEGEQIRLTISVGIATSNVDYDIQKLIKQADIALYMAKEQGRNRTIFYAE